MTAKHSSCWFRWSSSGIAKREGEEWAFDKKYRGIERERDGRGYGDGDRVRASVWGERDRSWLWVWCGSILWFHARGVVGGGQRSWTLVWFGAELSSVSSVSLLLINIFLKLYLFYYHFSIFFCLLFFFLFDWREKKAYKRFNFLCYQWLFFFGDIFIKKGPFSVFYLFFLVNVFLFSDPFFWVVAFVTKLVLREDSFLENVTTSPKPKEVEDLIALEFSAIDATSKGTDNHCRDLYVVLLCYWTCVVFNFKTDCYNLAD